MSPSATEYERASYELRRLQPQAGGLFPMDRGCEFPEFIARLQDTLDAVADAELLSRVAIKRPPAVAYEDNSLREAADHMVHEEVVRLPVVARDNPRKVIGWLTRSDLLTAHRQRLEDRSRGERALQIRTVRLDRSSAASL